ncbi:Uncharacterised protein [Vibrio cholerae]|nr:Uncharacterised protein [Vibrio cholerae]
MIEPTATRTRYILFTGIRSAGEPVPFNMRKQNRKFTTVMARPTALTPNAIP